MNIIISAAMEGNYAIYVLKVKSKTVKPRPLKYMDVRNARSCEHKSKCLYKYNAEKMLTGIRS